MSDLFGNHIVCFPRRRLICLTMTVLNGDTNLKSFTNLGKENTDIDVSKDDLCIQNTNKVEVCYMIKLLSLV